MHRFESLDLLSPKPKFFINSKKRYITILGIVLSFLIFLGYLSMIIYLFVEFLIGSSVTVVYSKEEITSDFYFNLTGKLFAFYLTDLATNSINSRLFIFKFKEIHIGFFVIVYKTISDEKVVQYYISKLELLSVLLDFYRETPSVLITKIQKSKLIEKNRIQKLTKKETKENSLQATDFAIENDNTIDYNILNKSYNSTIIFNYIIYTILLFSLYYIMCVIRSSPTYDPYQPNRPHALRLLHQRRYQGQLPPSENPGLPSPNHKHFLYGKKVPLLHSIEPTHRHQLRHPLP